MANKKTSDARKGAYTNYKTRGTQAKNRRIKLEAQLKKQPGNESQITLALGNIGYRRRTPKTPVWSASMIATARLYKAFTGKFDKGLFSPNTDTAIAASKVRNDNKFLQGVPKFETKASMFSLGVRARLS